MSESQVDFKVGDVVKIKAGTEHYGQDRSYNPADVLGVVVNVKTPDEEGYKYDVRWNTNCSNVYRPKDLELVVSAVQPTKDGTQADSSELEEALAKIESLESALEDAVRELISLRGGNNSAVIDVNQGEDKPYDVIQFKPVEHYTLEDWKEAMLYGWEFKTRSGDVVTIEVTDDDSDGRPIWDSNGYYHNLNGMWKELEGEDGDDIIKRVK